MRIRNRIKTFKSIFARGVNKIMATGRCRLAGHHGNAEDSAMRRARLAVLASIALLLVLEPSLAAAAAAAEDNPWTTVMSKITQSLMGPLGQSLGILAIIVMGVMAMFGRLAWDMALKVIFGTLLIFSSATIVKWVTGLGSVTTY